LSCCGGLLAVVLLGTLAWAAELMPPRLYEVTTETVMPHLEENLRYSNTHGKQCLAHQDLAVAFPILSHAALKGCKLERESLLDDIESYLLVCEGGYGTTGSATWRLGTHPIRGTLVVKLGGKNMTFYQRVTATPVGECASEAK
jgi:hypothetical protein